MCIFILELSFDRGCPHCWQFIEPSVQDVQQVAIKHCEVCLHTWPAMRHIACELECPMCVCYCIAVHTQHCMEVEDSHARNAPISVGTQQHEGTCCELRNQHVSVRAMRAMVRCTSISINCCSMSQPVSTRHHWSKDSVT